MHAAPPLNALRAFEAAARHLSLTKAAQELNVTPGAISHQIRGLETLLGVELFERRARSIALTPAGKLLHPGVQTGLLYIREAVASIQGARQERILVVSTPPGLTSKWLAPRLYRFASSHPDIDVRISSSINNADFTTDGIDVAVRNLPIDPRSDPALVIEKLVELSFVPVCSPRLIERHGPLRTAKALARAPLIHDDTFASRAAVPTWADWFRAAGIEGAGVLLAHDLLAYDDLRTGHLIIPVALALPSGRAYYLVRASGRRDRPQVRAFGRWIKEELGALDWTSIRGAARLRRTS